MTYADVNTPKITRWQVSFLIRHLKIKKSHKILDLGCGYGRHSLEFARRGFKVVGVDYSRYLLDIAKKQARKENLRNVKFLKADMRNLRYRREFDIVINMYTSFGYFEKEKDHRIVLRNISNTLKDSGKFFLDLENPSRIIHQIIKARKIDEQTGFLLA